MPSSMPLCVEHHPQLPSFLLWVFYAAFFYTVPSSLEIVFLTGSIAPYPSASSIPRIFGTHPRFLLLPPAIPVIA